MREELVFLATEIFKKAPKNIYIVNILHIRNVKQM